MKRIPIQIRVPIISDKQNCCPYEKPFGYIYKITNKINGHYYIGKHEFHHPWLDKSYKGSGKRLQKAYEKYGIKNFDFIILEWVNNEELLNTLEINWIKLFKSYKLPFHYNLTEGGDGVGSGENNHRYGYKMTREESEYLHSFSKNYKFTDEHRSSLKKRMTGKNNPMFGKYGIENNFYGHTHTKEQKLKWSEQRKGKFTGKNNPNYGNHKLAGGNNPAARKIVRFIDNKLPKVYLCIKDAVNDGFSTPKLIRKCCDGTLEQYKGYKWMYKEDYDKLYKIQEGTRINNEISKNYPL